ncbi:MAG: DMT family transporter [Fibrobacterota bacterium]
MTDKYSIKNIFAAVSACLLWGTAFPGVKLGLQYSGPLRLAGLRFMLAGILLIPFCGKPAKYLKTTARNLRTIIFISFLQTFLLYSLFFTGMSIVRGAQASIIIGSGPFFTAILAHFLMHDDRITGSKMTSIFFGIAGLCLISLSSKPWQPSGLAEFGGMGILLFSTLVSALANITVAKRGRDINPVILNSSQMFLGGISILLLSFITEGIPRGVPPAEFFLVLIWLSTVSALAFSIWFYLLTRKKTARLNSWKFLIPVFGSVLSWVILPDETPGIMSVSGMILVGTAIVLINIPRSFRQRFRKRT